MDASSPSTSVPSPRAPKRLRVDDHVDAAPAVVRSPDLWLSDGTIILRTSQRVKGSAKPIQMFYKAPQGVFEAASERYEGLPVMDMPDNANDVESFLNAMYLPDYLHRHGRHSSGAPFWSDFPRMYMGVLRLAKKYDAPKIRQVIANAVQKEWPTDLRYWDERQGLAVTDMRYAIKANLKCHVVYPEPAHTIRIAMDYDIPEILPVAYYDLFRVYDFNRAKDREHHAANIHVLTVDELCKLTVGMAALRDHVHSKLRHFFFRDRPRRWWNVCFRFDFDPGSDDVPETEIDGVSPCVKPLTDWWRVQFESLTGSGDPLDRLERQGSGSCATMVEMDSMGLARTVGRQ